MIFSASRRAVLPHAGYLDSGKTAGKVYRLLHIPATVVLIGPNHVGVGPAIATFASGSWETPLGPVRINARLAHALTSCCPQIIDDPEAHAVEHAIEVQLPFLQYLRLDVTFVTLLLGEVAPEGWQRSGEALAKTVASWQEQVLLLAGSDMTLYEDEQNARRKDQMAIAQMPALDSPASGRNCNHTRDRWAARTVTGGGQGGPSPAGGAPVG